MTEITIYNVQRAVTTKVGKKKVMFLVFYMSSNGG